MPAPQRIIAGLALLLFATTACGSEPTSEATGLELWTRSTPASAEVYKKVIAAYTAKTGVKVTYVPIYENFENKIQEAAAARDLPDVVINDVSLLGTGLSQGLITPVDRAGIAGAGDTLDRAWNQARAADGKYYGVPFSTQAVATFIRKDWREKLGKDVPKTWAELDALARAFQDDDPDGNGKDDTYGMLVPASTERGYTAWWASSYLWQGGGDFLTESGGRFTPAIDQPRSVEAVKWMRKLFCEDKVVVPGALTLITDDAHPFFETGKAGVYLTGPWMMGRFDKSLGKDRYEVVPSPAGPGGQGVLGEGENIYLMAGSKLGAQQKQLAEFLISPEGQRIGMNTDQPNPVVRLPVNTTVDVVAERKDERWATIKKIYENDGRLFPQVPNWTPLRQQAAETLNSIFANCGADVQAELTKLAGSFRTELAKQKAG
ncbi:sugar ABC transporter substrate-binding protein [Streptosporangium sp. NPDC002524]|uniref:ABC transporter substrate-binding protein n=1 Tax=Streptosporangium sp. NPDC002524 TaxID=3154537 RepID=UPI00332B0F78